MSATELRARVLGLVRQGLAELGILATHEYRVADQAGRFVNLRATPETARAGLPEALSRVLARPCICGASIKYAPDSLVLVSFVRGDPTRPFIAHGGEVGASSTKPLEVAIDAADEIGLGAAHATVLRDGDFVALDTISVPGRTIITLDGLGAPAPPPSKVQA